MSSHDAALTSAPASVHQPSLGRPGLLTEQPEAGKLSLQRPLKHGERLMLFDQVHGCGWRLLSLGHTSVEAGLSADSRSFFTGVLGGRCISVSPEEDVCGEYTRWFADDMGADHVVLIRPDFYVFGHAPVAGVNGLVQLLKAKVTSE